MLSGNHFAQYAAQMIALDPQVQRYALDANANRPNRETVRILTSLLTAALRPEQDYRLPVPRCWSTASSTTSATSPWAPGHGRSASRWPSTS